MEADFSGYATKNGLLCADGRTIVAGAFKDNDRQTVPLVWQHQHDVITNVLGHGILEDRADGTYVYGFFNDTPDGLHAKAMVKHGDVNALSIFANKLVQKGKNVVHGAIKEVSLVLAGANPGALIDNVSLAHSENGETLIDEAIIYEDLGISLAHSDLIYDEEEDQDRDENDVDEELTNEDVIHSLDDDQRGTLYDLLEDALAHSAGTLDLDEVEDDIDVEGFLDSLSDEQHDTVVDLLNEALNSNADEAELGHADTTKEGSDMAEETVKDVYDTLSDKQKQVVDFLIGSAANGDTVSHSDDDENTLQHSEGTNVNVFDQSNIGAGNGRSGKTLSHGQIRQIVKDGIRQGSLREGVLMHAEEYGVLMHADDYGITNIELLFPDAKATSASPELIARQAEWVPKVLDATKKAPFAKIKSIVADLTADEARAKGYVKGNLKKEEVVELLKRETGPATIYKKQKLDRDDIIDIVDFDVIAWLKWEIRFMLNEEIARAILIGDGRSAGDEDRIKDPRGALSGNGIRSILHDNDMYAHKLQLPANTEGSALVDAVAAARLPYRGSGNPTFYTTDVVLTKMLLERDLNGQRLYSTEAELASALRVKELVAVEVMEGIENLVGIIVNLVDYTVGTNAGGELSFFEDFDIDFNQNKYLMEARMSGALTRPKAAVVITLQVGTEVTATAPSFNGVTNTITVPNKTGVLYTVDGELVTGNVVITKDTEVLAEADDDYYLATGSTKQWNYTHTA